MYHLQSMKDTHQGGCTLKILGWRCNNPIVELCTDQTAECTNFHTYLQPTLDVSFSEAKIAKTYLFQESQKLFSNSKPTTVTQFEDLKILLNCKVGE